MYSQPSQYIDLLLVWSWVNITDYRSTVSCWCMGSISLTQIVDIWYVAISQSDVKDLAQNKVLLQIVAAPQWIYIAIFMVVDTQSYQCSFIPCINTPCNDWSLSDSPQTWMLTLSMTLNISLAPKPQNQGFSIPEGCGAQHSKLQGQTSVVCVAGLKI